MNKSLLLSCLILVANIGFSQTLKPGFDKREYIEMLKLTSKHTNPDFFKEVPAPDHFTLLYRSPIVGMDNTFEVWTNKNGVAAISVRGTTAKPESWLENFYAAMVPATGTLKISNSNTFHYRLADHPKAAVHTGWLLALGSMAPGILDQVQLLYKSGTREIILVGHSQGGAITYLLTAYLYQLQKQSLLPKDIRFKTYCSAGPKPGNLFFAYDYEEMTQEGWAYNVVNASDWVPEVPLTVQTTDDFVEINPFRNVKGMLKKQKFPKNIALRHLYNRMDKPSRRARKNYRKVLGNTLSKMVQKNMKEMDPPEYFNSSNYVRVSPTIILKGDEAYFKKYPNDKEKIFQHHMPDVYYYLATSLWKDNLK